MAGTSCLNCLLPVYYLSATSDAHITVCQGQPKKHAKQRLSSNTLLGLANGIPCKQQNRKQRLPSGTLVVLCKMNESAVTVLNLMKVTTRNKCWKERENWHQLAAEPRTTYTLTWGSVAQAQANQPVDVGRNNLPFLSL